MHALHEKRIRRFNLAAGVTRQVVLRDFVFGGKITLVRPAFLPYAPNDFTWGLCRGIQTKVSNFMHGICFTCINSMLTIQDMMRLGECYGQGKQNRMDAPHL